MNSVFQNDVRKRQLENENHKSMQTQIKAKRCILKSSTANVLEKNLDHSDSQAQSVIRDGICALVDEMLENYLAENQVHANKNMTHQLHTW